MRLQVFKKRLKALLSTPVEQRDSIWAYKLCQLTRFAVQKLFKCWPDSAEVQDFLDALSGLPEAVRNAKKVGPYADRLDKFASNMELRLAEFRAYIAEIDVPVAAGEPITSE